MEYDPVKNPLTREQIDVKVDAYLKSLDMPKESVEETRAQIYKGFEERGYNMSPALTEEQIAEIEQEEKQGWIESAKSSSPGVFSGGAPVPMQTGKPIELQLERLLGKDVIELLNDINKTQLEASIRVNEVLTQPLIKAPTGVSPYIPPAVESAARSAAGLLGAVAETGIAALETAFSPLHETAVAVARENIGYGIETTKEYKETLASAHAKIDAAEAAVDSSKISDTYMQLPHVIAGFGEPRSMPRVELELIKGALAQPNLTGKERSALAAEFAALAGEILVVEAAIRAPLMAKQVIHAMDDIAMSGHLGARAKRFKRITDAGRANAPEVAGEIRIPITPEPIGPGQPGKYAAAVERSVEKTSAPKIEDVPQHLRGVEGYWRTRKLRNQAMLHTDQIISQTEALFNVPIREKLHGAAPVRVRVKANAGSPLGYDPHQGVITVRRSDDLEEMSVNLAKHIEKTDSETRRFIVENRKALKEFVPKDLPDEADLASEGFAEFLSQWITGSRNPKDVGKLRLFERVLVEGEHAPISSGAGLVEKFKMHLAQNEALGAKLNAIQDSAIRWAEQGAAKAIRAHWASTEKIPLGERANRFWLDFRRKWTDDLALLDNLVKEITTKTGVTLRPTKDPVTLLRSYRMTAERKAAFMAEDGVFDLAGMKTGPSLREAMEHAGGEPDKFIDYIVAKRALEIEKKGLVSGVNREQANFIANSYYSDNFEMGFNKLKAFVSARWDMMEQSGAVSHKARMIMEALNQDYVPWMRQIEGGGFLSVKTRGYSNLGGPIVKMRGGTGRIHSPIEAFLKQTADHIKLAQKAEISRAMAGLTQFEGMGQYIRKVNFPKEARQMSAQGIGRMLEDLGIKLNKAGETAGTPESIQKFLETFDLGDIGGALKKSDIEDVVTFYHNKAFVNAGKDNTVSFWVDGKRQAFELHPDIYETLETLEPVMMKGYLSIIEGAASLLKVGATGYNPRFSLITNPIRDTITSGLQTQFGTGLSAPLDMLHGLGMMMQKGNKWNRLYNAAGGPMSTMYGVDKVGLKRQVAKLVKRGLVDDTINVLGHPRDMLAKIMDATRDALSFTERGPRLAEFRKAYLKGEEMWGAGSQDALIFAERAASEVTVDFKRAGLYSKALNQLIPFYNPATQGLTRFGREFQNNPLKASLKGAALTTAMLSIYAINRKNHKEDMDAIEPWENAAFIHLFMGKNSDGSARLYRIPLPFEWGVIFGAIPKTLIDYELNKADVEDSMSGQTMRVGNQEKRNAELWAQLEALVPPFTNIPLLTPYNEIQANKSFFKNRELYPEYLKRMVPLEGDRYNAWTTQLAKDLGQAAPEYIQPTDVDHIIKSLTGGAGLEAVKVKEAIFDKKKMTRQEVQQRAEDMYAAGYPPATVLRYIERWIKNDDHPSNMPMLGWMFSRTRPPIDMLQVGIRRIKQEKVLLGALVKKRGLMQQRMDEQRNKVGFSFSEEEKSANWDELDTMRSQSQWLATRTVETMYRINLETEKMKYYAERLAEEGGNALELFELDDAGDLAEKDLGDKFDIEKVVGEIYEKEKKK